VLTDLAVRQRDIGGDFLAGVALPRAEPELVGQVASDPTVSQTVDRFVGGVDRTLMTTPLDVDNVSPMDAHLLSGLPGRPFLPKSKSGNMKFIAGHRRTGL